MTTHKVTGEEVGRTPEEIRDTAVAKPAERALLDAALEVGNALLAVEEFLGNTKGRLAQLFIDFAREAKGPGA